MSIPMTCECGKKLNVKDEMAGRRIKCPGCQQVLTVPAAEEEPLIVAVASAPPVPPPVIEDDDYDQPRPRRKRRQAGGQSKTLLYVGLGAGALLFSCCCLGGIGVWIIARNAPVEKELGTPPIEEKDQWTAFDPKITITVVRGGALTVPYKAYKISLKAKTQYTIELIHRGGPSDPYLLVKDGLGTILAQDDDSGGNLNARILFTPQLDGDYHIVAATIGGFGDFTLKVTLTPIVKNVVPPPQPPPGKDFKPPPNTPTQPKRLGTLPVVERAGWTAKDPVHPKTKQPYKSYTITLTAFKTYTIDLIQGGSPQQDPWLILEDSNGNVVAEDDDSGGGLNARIVYTPVSGGDFRIIATTIHDGIGNFTLRVQENKQ